MAVTFKGSAIGKERGASGTNGFPRPKRKAASSVLHTLDGGNRVQHSGRGMDTLTLRLRASAAELNSLTSAVASSGTLAYSGGSRTAFLDEIGEPEEHIFPSITYYFVTATFLLT